MSGRGIPQTIRQPNFLIFTPLQPPPAHDDDIGFRAADNTDIRFYRNIKWRQLIFQQLSRQTVPPRSFVTGSLFFGEQNILCILNGS